MLYSFDFDWSMYPITGLKSILNQGCFLIWFIVILVLGLTSNIFFNKSIKSLLSSLEYVVLAVSIFWSNKAESLSWKGKAIYYI